MSAGGGGWGAGFRSRICYELRPTEPADEMNRRGEGGGGAMFVLFYRCWRVRMVRGFCCTRHGLIVAFGVARSGVALFSLPAQSA